MQSIQGSFILVSTSGMALNKQKTRQIVHGRFDHGVRFEGGHGGHGIHGGYGASYAGVHEGVEESAADITPVDVSD